MKALSEQVEWLQQENQELREMVRQLKEKLSAAEQKIQQLVIHDFLSAYYQY